MNRLSNYLGAQLNNNLSKKLTAALSAAHPPNEWAFFSELRESSGFTKKNDRRFDAFAINLFPSKQNETRCFEIKVSKEDFKREIDTPLKRRAGMIFSNKFYFVTPPALLKIDDIPLGCGLMEVNENLTISTIVPAPYRNIYPPNFAFVASILRTYDKDRAKELSAFLKAVEGNRQTDVHAIKILLNNIEKWKNYNYGSKEIPDIIAAELEKILVEVQAVHNQRWIDSD